MVIRLPAHGLELREGRYAVVILLCADAWIAMVIVAPTPGQGYIDRGSTVVLGLGRRRLAPIPNRYVPVLHAVNLEVVQSVIEVLHRRRHGVFRYNDLRR